MFADFLVIYLCSPFLLSHRCVCVCFFYCVRFFFSLFIEVSSSDEVIAVLSFVDYLCIWFDYPSAIMRRGWYSVCLNYFIISWERRSMMTIIGHCFDYILVHRCYTIFLSPCVYIYYVYPVFFLNLIESADIGHGFITITNNFSLNHTNI